MRVNFKTLRLLALPVGVCLLLAMTQQLEPVAKEGLLKSLGRKALSSRELVEQVERRGVTFKLTADDEKEIRLAGKYLEGKGLDALIDAVRQNYRPSPSPQATPTPPKLEQPTFREKLENVTVSLGGMGFGYPYSALESKEGTPILIGDFAPLRLRVTDGKLYVDVKVYSGDKPPIEINNNEFVVRPPDWDKNSNERALEVVDGKQKPVFQLIYKGKAMIQINGIFVGQGHVMLASERETIGGASPESIAAFSLKPIFKYPSWKYPGQYADEAPTPTPIIQTMINSPGGIQAGRDVVIQSDRRLIQSLVLRTSVEVETAATDVTEVQTDVGLQSALALFTTDKTRIRFVTDYQVMDKQVRPNRRRLSFVYTPETPSEIQGREVRFLESIHILAINYAEIFKLEQFATNKEPVTFLLTVEVNGVALGSISTVSEPGVLSAGQANMDVSAFFRELPKAYDKAVSR